VALDYAMTYSPWQKHLGFTLAINKDERTVVNQQAFHN